MEMSFYDKLLMQMFRWLEVGGTDLYRDNTHAYVTRNAYPTSATMHLYSPEVPGT